MYTGGIYHTTLNDGDLYTIEYQATWADAHVSHIRGLLCRTVDDFFREISSSMRFPFYFGQNWDAFDECITDLEWLKFKSIQIVFDHFEHMFTAYDDLSERKKQLALLEKYLSIAYHFWEEQGIAFTVIFNESLKKTP